MKLVREGFNLNAGINDFNLSKHYTPLLALLRFNEPIGASKLLDCHDIKVDSIVSHSAPAYKSCNALHIAAHYPDMEHCLKKIIQKSPESVYFVPTEGRFARKSILMTAALIALNRLPS